MSVLLAIKAVFETIGDVFRFLKDRQLINAGKAEQANAQSQETLETVRDAVRPITDDDRERVWARLQAKRSAK